MYYFSNILPNLTNILGLSVFLILIYFLLIIGKTVTKSQNLALNFASGWSIFLILFHFFTISLNLRISIFFISFIVIIFIIFFLNKKPFIKLENYKFFIVLLPLFFLLISAKSFGWDTFAFYLPRIDYLIQNDKLPTEIFRSNYPFSSTILYHFVNFFFNKHIENIPAIFDFFLLFFTSLIYIDFLKSQKIDITNFTPFIFILIFFNPMIMNVYSYSMYEDLHVSFIIFVIVYFLHLKKFSINNFDNLNSIVFGLLLSLLSLIKITGVVHAFSIGLFFILINLKRCNFNTKNFIKMLIVFLISISQLIIWYFHIFKNEIYIATDISGFREEIFNNIFYGYLKSFYQKKILILSIFFIPMVSLFYFFKKRKLDETLCLLFIISFINIIWNIFLLYWLVYMQTYTNAYEFHDFSRYISQLSLIFLFGYFIIIKDFLKKFIIYFNKKILGVTFSIIFILLTFIFVEKIRRDLNPLMINLDINIPKIKNYQNMPFLIKGENIGYIKEILRYKLKNIKFINKEINDQFITLISKNGEISILTVNSYN